MIGGESPTNRTRVSGVVLSSSSIQDEIKTSVLDLFRQKPTTRPTVGAYNPYGGGSYEQVSRRQMLSGLKERTVVQQPASTTTNEALNQYTIPEDAPLPEPTINSANDIAKEEKFIEKENALSREMHEEEFQTEKYQVEAPKSGLLFRDEILSPIYLPTKYEDDLIEPMKELRRTVSNDNEEATPLIIRPRELIYCRYPSFFESYQKENHNKKFLESYNGLLFDSNFECGNLFSVEYVLPPITDQVNENESSQNEIEEYDLYLDCDPIYQIDDDDFRATNNAINNSYILKVEKKFFLKQVKEYEKAHSISNISLNHWYFFRITNTKRGQKYRFNIHYLSKSDSNHYQQGLKPLFLSQQNYHRHQKGWKREGEVTSFTPSSHKRMWPTKVDGPMICNDYVLLHSKCKPHTLSFSFTSENVNDTVYISSHPLYTYSQLQVMLSSLLTRNHIKPNLQVHRISRTLAGNNCDLVIITKDGALVKDGGLTNELDQVHRTYHASSTTSTVAAPPSGGYSITDLLNPKSYIAPLNSSIIDPKSSENPSIEEVMKNKLETLDYDPTENISLSTKSMPKYLQRLQVSLEANYELQTKKKVGKNRKTAIIILGRIHPYETNSNWIIEGIIKFLLSDNEFTERLRSSFVFYIFPMINIDGVINGFNKLSICGDDYQNCWISPSSMLHPEVHRIKSIIHRLYQTTTIASIFQLRAHAPRDGIYFHSSVSRAPAPIYLQEAESRRTTMAISNSNLANTASDEIIPTVGEFYNAVANRSVLLSIKHCSLHPPTSSSKSLRSIARNDYQRIPIAGTLHASQFRGPPGTIFNRSHLRPFDYAKFAGEFCLALGDTLRAFEEQTQLAKPIIPPLTRETSTVVLPDRDESRRKTKISPPRGTILRSSLTLESMNTRESFRSSKFTDALNEVAQKFNNDAENGRNASPIRTNYQYSTISSYYIGDVDILDESSLTQRELLEREHYNERLVDEKIQVETNKVRLDRIEQYNEKIWQINRDFSSSDEEEESENEGENHHHDRDKDIIKFDQDEREIIEYRFSELQKQFDLSLQRSLSKFFRRSEAIGFPKSFFTTSNTNNKDADTYDTEREYPIQIPSSTFLSIPVSFHQYSQGALPYMEVLEKKKLMKEQLENINKKNLQQIIQMKFNNSDDDYNMLESDEIQAKLDEIAGNRKTMLHRNGKNGGSEDDESSKSGTGHHPRKRVTAVRKTVRRTRVSTIKGRIKRPSQSGQPSPEHNLMSGESGVSSAEENSDFSTKNDELEARLFRLANSGQRETLVQALIARKRFDTTFLSSRRSTEDDEEEYDVEKNVELQRKIQELRELYATKAAAEMSSSVSPQGISFAKMTEEEQDQLILKQLIEENYLPASFLQMIVESHEEENDEHSTDKTSALPASFILSAISKPKSDRKTSTSQPKPKVEEEQSPSGDVSVATSASSQKSRKISKVHPHRNSSVRAASIKPKPKEIEPATQIEKAEMKEVESRRHSISFDVDLVLEKISRVTTASAKEGIHPDSRAESFSKLSIEESFPDIPQTTIKESGIIEEERRNSNKEELPYVENRVNDTEVKEENPFLVFQRNRLEEKARLIITDEIDEIVYSPRRHIEIIREYLLVNKGKKNAKDGNSSPRPMTKEEAYRQFIKETGFQYEFVLSQLDYSSDEEKRKSLRHQRRKHVHPDLPTSEGSLDSSQMSSTAQQGYQSSSRPPTTGTIYLRQPLFQYYDYIIQQLSERKVVPPDYLYIYGNQIFQSLYSKHQLFVPKKFVKNPVSTQTSPERKGRDGSKIDYEIKQSERKAESPPPLLERSSLEPIISPLQPAPTPYEQKMREFQSRSLSPEQLLEEDKDERKKRVDQRFHQISQMRKEKKELERSILASISKSELQNGTIPIPSWLSSDMKTKVMNIILQKHRKQGRDEDERVAASDASWISGYHQILQRSLLSETSKLPKTTAEPSPSIVETPTPTIDINKTETLVPEVPTTPGDAHDSENETLPILSPRQAEVVVEIKKPQSPGLVLKPAVNLQLIPEISPAASKKEKNQTKTRGKSPPKPKRVIRTTSLDKAQRNSTDSDLMVIANQTPRKEEILPFGSNSIDFQSSIEIKNFPSLESQSLSSVSKADRLAVITLEIPSIYSKSVQDDDAFGDLQSPQKLQAMPSFSLHTDDSFSLSTHHTIKSEGVSRLDSNDTAYVRYGAIYQNKISRLSFDFDQEKIALTLPLSSNASSMLSINSGSEAPLSHRSGKENGSPSSLLGKKLFTAKPPGNPKPSSHYSPFSRKRQEMMEANVITEGSVETVSGRKTIVRIHTPQAKSNQNEGYEDFDSRNDMILRAGTTTSSAELSMQTN